MIHLPYGSGHLPLAMTQGMQLVQATPPQTQTEQTGLVLVQQAMEQPIGAPRLEALAKGKPDAVVLISDHTRPVPSKDILPPMLSALRAGNPDIALTLLVATGCHRGTTPKELREKLGDAIFERERVVVHDCQDEDNLVDIGVLPSGAVLRINTLAAEASLLVAEGFIEPHFFAGFSGGRKSVLPGICSLKTVLGNHCSAFISDPRARAGQLRGNPIHTDMLAAQRMAKLAFICNVVLDQKQRTIAAFCGDAEQAHLAGCAFLEARCTQNATPADIVVVTNDGAPLDQNVYQCVKGLCTAAAAAKPGAVLIMCAECADGLGGEAFFKAASDPRTPADVLAAIHAVPQEETKPDQWQVQILMRIRKAHPILFVTAPCMQEAIEQMHMEYARSIDEALASARRRVGAHASVAVIPHGVSTIVTATS